MSLSDRSHFDTCAATRCNTMDVRSNMVKATPEKPVAGRKRGYVCQQCAGLVPRPSLRDLYKNL